MAEFLLLGHIPGTSMYISFWIWLAMVEVLLCAFLAYRLLFARRQLWYAVVFMSVAIGQRPVPGFRPSER